MRRIFSNPNWSTYRSDFFASIVVFLVALPLCIGIAIASGAPPASGLIAGIIGGIIVGALAGAPLQVSGPAAGLSVIVWETIHRFGLEALGVITVIAGLFQVLAGLLRCGQWFRAVSPAVVNGMLSGIGLLILASQLHVMLDLAPKGSGIANVLGIPHAIWSVIAGGVTSAHAAALLGILTLIVVVLWEKNKTGIATMFPGALAAVIVTSAVAYLLHAPLKMVQVPDSILGAINFPDISRVPALLSNWQIWTQGIAIGLVTSAQTLLTSIAVDRMQHYSKTKYDQELLAQGTGNIACGIFGALPLAGVIVRSTANIQAGARTRLSTILHGCWLLLLVSLTPHVLELIPMAALSALLVHTGYKLLNPKVALELYRGGGKSELAIYLATIAAIVCTDLLKGVLFGLALSMARLVWIFSHLEIGRDDPMQGKTTLSLQGAATFVSLPKLARALESVPHNTELHIKLDGLTYIDHACIDLLMNWEKDYKSAGGTLVLDWQSVEAKFKGVPVGRKELSKVA